MATPPSPLEGTWQLIRAELDGEQAPELVVTKTVVTLSGASYEVRFADEVADRGALEIDVTSAVASFRLHGREGPNAGRTIPCIYQLRQDRLRVCYGLDGVKPTEFATASGQQRFLATYRRT